jgi:parallel beta-helix repeat protein
VPVDGAVIMTFSLYDMDTGGTAQWSDTRSVTVNQGVFSVELGVSPNTFPINLFEMPLWMGLTVDGDTEMLPRRPVTSTAFAFKAQDANRLEGSTAAVIDQSAHVADTANPHNVTAGQVGAADAGTVAAHIDNTANPHAVTAAQTGAASDSTLTGNTAYKNGRWGIYGLGSNLIKDNLIYFNNTSGIAGEGGLRVGSSSRVIGNTLVSNAVNNVFVSYSDNIIKDNHVTDSNNGIIFNASGNFYGNSASGNTTNFNLNGTTQTTSTYLPNISF